MLRPVALLQVTTFTNMPPFDLWLMGSSGIEEGEEPAAAAAAAAAALLTNDGNLKRP